MKFSLSAASALLLTAFATFSKADQFGDAMKQWCQGLDVTSPAATDTVVAGASTSVTVTRVPDQHQKEITGLDLYSVSSDGQAKYVQNIWAGQYNLDSTATLPDTIPANVSAGLYYYRVWVTNEIDGNHGPDCIETSHTFKVTSGSHTNADGSSYYSESLDDASVYHPDHYRGCFGLSVDYPEQDSTFKTGDHIRVAANRDTSSQTDSLTQVDLYMIPPGSKVSHFISTVWTGSEVLVNAFTLKDHLNLPEDKLVENAMYYYLLKATSKKDQDGDACEFKSKQFKIEKSN